MTNLLNMFDWKIATNSAISDIMNEIGEDVVKDIITVSYNIHGLKYLVSAETGLNHWLKSHESYAFNYKDIRRFFSGNPTICSFNNLKILYSKDGHRTIEEMYLFYTGDHL